MSRLLQFPTTSTTRAPTSSLDTDSDLLNDAYESGSARYEVVFSPSSISWTQANTTASKMYNSLGVRGHLATITTSAENTVVEDVMQESQATLTDGCWIGGVKVNGAWGWVTGESFSYTRWNSGEPNNYLGVENYLMVSYSGNRKVESRTGIIYIPDLLMACIHRFYPAT